MSDLTKQSQPPQAVLDQIIGHYNQGELEQTVSLAESLAGQYPNTLLLYDILGAAYMGLNDTDKTIASYQKALQLNPTHTDAYNNMGMALYDQGRFDEAVECYQKAVTHEPDFADAHYNLANALKQSGDLKKAIESYRASIAFNPNDAEVLLNYGNALKDYGEFEQAIGVYALALKIDPTSRAAQTNKDNAIEIQTEIDKLINNFSNITKLGAGSADIICFTGTVLAARGYLEAGIDSYKQAIKIKPDFAQAHYNLGNILQEKEDLDAAIESYKQATKIDRNFMEAYFNIGNAYKDKGDFKEAINSYRQALNIKPNFFGALSNLIYLLQSTRFQSPPLEGEPVIFPQEKYYKDKQISKSILKFRLDLGEKNEENSLNNAIKVLSNKENIHIKNPYFNNSKKLLKPDVPGNIVAMVHFGRSGTGLLHSLIDGHSEASTLPSIYFSEFFDPSVWNKIIASGWDEIVNCFIANYQVFFDAACPDPVASISGKSIGSLGCKEGMVNVGSKKNEILRVDKKVFRRELSRLLRFHDRLDAFVFFKLVHSAYNKAVKDFNEKSLIFYHIHNPDTLAQLNFLRLAPNAKWIMMVREPLQSCESWTWRNFQENNYEPIANKIFAMLFEIDNVIFRNRDALGVRLEDLKEHPHKTILALCRWMGIQEEDILYQMTVQGKKWWGDPSSPDFAEDGMNPFGKTSISRKVGLVFSNRDQFILRTLFYPFSVRFGYVKKNIDQYKIDLRTIRPMLDQMFDFERTIVERTQGDKEKFITSSPYLYLRSGMVQRWNTLNEFHTYPNILKPLKIN